MIRFRRVVEKGCISWFAYVEAGLDLKINAWDLNKPDDIIVGPLHGFSVVEYGDRAVFLYLNKEAVNHNPSFGVTKPNTRIVDYPSQLTLNGVREAKGWMGKRLGGREGSRKNSDESKKTPEEQGAKGQQKTIEDQKGKQKSQPAVSNAKPLPEVLSDDVKPCEYFEMRMKEWRKLRDKTNITVTDPLPARRSPTGSYPWIEDHHISRAIASVVTAIELENDVPFALVSDVTAQTIREGMVLDHKDNLPVDWFGEKQELFLPWNDNVMGNGIHWILVHVKDSSRGPQIRYYDSLGNNWPRDSANCDDFRIAVRNLLWYGGEIDDQPDYSDAVSMGLTAQQDNAWACGHLTILNAWCLALGLTPNHKLEQVFKRMGDLVEMINLALAGLMDSATILAFVRCVKFVVPMEPATVPVISSDRHFSRTVPFLSEIHHYDYIRERRRIAQRPNVPPIRREVIEQILKYGNFGYSEDDIRENLVSYHQFLGFMDIEGPKSPLSPVSPITMRRVLEAAANTGIALPTTLPQGDRDLKQIFDIYRKLLDTDGVLGTVRLERAQEKADDAAAGVIPMDTSEELRSPIYGNAAKTALGRLDRLPSKVVLTPEEIAEIRQKKKGPTLKLKLGKKKT